jgi:glycerol uptake facilitator-like aquaporin
MFSSFASSNWSGGGRSSSSSDPESTKLTVSDSGVDDDSNANLAPCVVESGPEWDYSTMPERGFIQLVGTFMMQITCLLIVVSYDAQRAPLSAATAVSLTFFMVISICPGYHFNPAATIAGALIPLTPYQQDDTNRVKWSNGGQRGKFIVQELRYIVVSKLPRLLFDFTAQIAGSILAAVLVWQGMNLSGTDVASRFNAQVREDLAMDPFGGSKVFWYVFIFNCMFAIVYYGIRFADRRTTCTSVNLNLTPPKIAVVCLAYFLFTAALAPFIGVGGINLLVTLGPAAASSFTPMYYAYIVLGQCLAFLTVAAMFRYIIFPIKRECVTC